MIKNYLKVFACLTVLYGAANSTTNPCEIAQICVTDITEDECFGTEILVPNSHIRGCCPSCQQPPPFPTPPVTPPTGCGASSNCLPDGRFAAVQCSGDRFTGRCFCTDERGNRIFGQMWRGEANDMTCACSRRRAELEESENRGVTLHCTPTGDYEPLQCDDGMCWCARPSTGQPTAGPVPEADMRHLPCYSSTAVGENYLRRCESTVHALAAIHREQSEHGTNFLGDPTTFCDYDGSYGRYQIRNGVAFCSGRDGEMLGSWQVITTEMEGMNCNCARDTMVYFPERGMTVTEVCTTNGNYRPNQNVGDVFYCVDSNGYPTTDFKSQWPDDECRSFA